MSEFKGTKGEWYRYTESRIVSSVYSRNEHKLIHISGGNTEEKKANAQLIAHAPQMLEMLKSCLSFIDEIKDYGIDKWPDEDKLKQLIQHATTIK